MGNYHQSHHRSYSCISPYETDECKTPINIGDQTYFINPDLRQTSVHVIIQELTDAQKEFYDMGSGDVRYVSGTLKRRHHVEGTRGKNLFSINGALTQKQIREAVESLFKHSKERVRV